MIDLVLCLNQRGVAQRKIGRDLSGTEAVCRIHVDGRTTRARQRDGADTVLGRIGAVEIRGVQRRGAVERQLRRLRTDEFNA